MIEGCPVVDQVGILTDLRDLTERTGGDQAEKPTLEYLDGVGYLDIGDASDISFPSSSSSCQYFWVGHCPHWIQNNRSAEEPHRTGTLTDVTGFAISVDFGDETKYYNNHEPQEVIEAVGIGGTVRVCEDFSIVRSLDGRCYSIADAERPWRECDFTPLMATSFDDLAERLRTHGGYSIPGERVLEWLEMEGNPS